MGLGAAAIAGIASAVVGAGSAAYGMYQGNKQAKAQEVPPRTASAKKKNSKPSTSNAPPLPSQP